MYLEIDEGFPGHRKTLRMCSILKSPEAGWYMIRLWTWACRSCPTGDLTGLSSYDIEMAAQYRALDGACYSAMVSAGFIDVDENGPKQIHGWMDHTGGAIKRMDEAAEAKKAYRAHKDGKCDRQSCPHCLKEAGRPVDCPKTVQGQSEDETWTNQTKTRQDQSSPDKTSQDKKETLPARDPVVGTTEHVARDGHRQFNGHDLCCLFGRLRLEILKLQCPPGSENPPDANGKASTFANSLTRQPGAFEDVEATMRAFLWHLKRGDKGWDADPNNASLSFGAWRDRFGDLRIEIAAAKLPKPANAIVPRKDGKPGQQARY